MVEPQLPSQETPPTATQLPTTTETITQEPLVTQTPGPVILRLWVPPEFDPSADTQTGDLLQSRLDAFTNRRPGVQIEVRVKALTGVGGMMETLSAASAAAPLSMPDLVAMPREMMADAALKGLLLPYDNLTDFLESADWYAYAQDMAFIQNSIYGMPFAGDAQVMVYRTDLLPEPPEDWQTTIENGIPLVYPAADPLALFTLNMYQANAGQVSDESGEPMLDPEVLFDVLSFYADAEGAGVMPFWLTQYQDDEQVWAALQEDRSGQLATWASSYYAQPMDNLALTALPTPDGKPYTLAKGWVWALATPTAENQSLSVELAEFLVDAGFLMQLNEASGYLPVRPSSLSSGYDPSQRVVIGRVLQSAKLFPPQDIIDSLGVPLQLATVEVLNRNQTR